MSRRDRYGELVDDQAADDVHDPECVDGWLPDTPDGRAVPCLHCKPHLADRRAQVLRRLQGPVR